MAAFGKRDVIPAKAGTQSARVGALNEVLPALSEATSRLRSRTLARWVPAFAGMTMKKRS
jgi:hypothetical protein